MSDALFVVGIIVILYFLISLLKIIFTVSMHDARNRMNHKIYEEAISALDKRNYLKNPFL